MFPRARNEAALMKIDFVRTSSLEDFGDEKALGAAAMAGAKPSDGGPSLTILVVDVLSSQDQETLPAGQLAPIRAVGAGRGVSPPSWAALSTNALIDCQTFSLCLGREPL